MHLFKDTNNFSKVYSSCQNIGNGHCYLVREGGGGRQMVYPPFSKNPVRNPVSVVAMHILHA